MFSELKQGSTTRSWWNAECTEAKAQFRESRTEEDMKVFYRVLNKTRNQYFWDIVEETTNKGRVWDLLPWLGPRPSPVQIALKEEDGTHVKSLDAVWRRFHTHFMKTENVEVEGLPDYLQMPEREWHRFMASDVACGELLLPLLGWPCLDQPLLHAQ